MDVRAVKRQHSHEDLAPAKRPRSHSPPQDVAPAAPAAPVAPAGVTFQGLVRRPKPPPKDAFLTEEERVLLREVDPASFEGEEKEDEEDDDDLGVTSAFGGEDGLELEGVPKVGKSALRRMEGLSAMRAMWQGDPAEVLDQSLLPKEQVGDKWVAKETMKWQEELLWELGVLSRYGGHQEVNRLLIERRDARMQEKGQTGPEWACMKWRDAQSLRLQFQEEGRHEGVCGGRKVLVKVHHQTTT